MNIKKVKIVSDGNQGLNVEYVEKVTKGDRDYDLFRNDKHTHPIIPELQESLDKLKIHLLRLCRLWDPAQDQHIDETGYGLKVPATMNEPWRRMKSLIDDLIVTGVTSNLENFLIIGKMPGECPGNINVLSMNVMPGSEYIFYDEVIEIVDELYQNVGKYIEYKGVIAAKQVVLEENIKDEIPFDNQKSDKEFLKEAEDIKSRTGVVVEMPVVKESEEEKVEEKEERKVATAPDASF